MFPEPFDKFVFPEIGLDCLRAFSVIYESAYIGFFLLLLFKSKLLLKEPKRQKSSLKIF